MKNTLLIISAFFFLSLIISGCCGCGRTDGNVMKGRIVVIGNEPFARVALSVEENKVYALECSEEMQKELLKNQGLFYAVKYIEIKTVNELPVMVVEEITKLNENDKNKDEK